MPFEPGKSGNPGGRTREKPFTDALRMALSEEHATTGTKKLRVLAEKLVNEAIDGNVQAMKEVADRMEGKAPQALQIGGDSDNPVLHAVKIEHVRADGPSSDTSET